MSTPIVEQIAADIQVSVNGVTLLNGFNQDLEAVRPTRVGFEDDSAPQDCRVVIIQEDPDEDEANSAEGNVGMKAWIQPFALVAFVISSDTVTTPIDTRINQVRADIEKKLMEDPNRDGLAIDTRIRSSGRFSEGPGATGIVVMVDVLYRTPVDDPYRNA